MKLQVTCDTFECVFLDEWIDRTSGLNQQVTQETENLMIQQITGQTAQQAPPLPTTAQEMDQHAASNVAAEATPDPTKIAQQGGQKSPTEGEKREMKRFDNMSRNT